MKEDGSVVTWGDEEAGGDSDSVKSELKDGVRQVVGNAVAFAAVKEDGSVVTWGDAGQGGKSDEVRDQLSWRCSPRRWMFVCLCRREGRRLRRHVGR